MSFEEEFKTVELLRSSKAETRAVDAFSLSLIKAERQVRKIFTHLIYQFNAFNTTDIYSLVDALASNRKVYFEGFIKGFNKIYPKSLKQIYGNGYANDLLEIKKAIRYRNKIFHGQLTGDNLSRDDLLLLVGNIQKWCKTLSARTNDEIGYGGFERDSYRKTTQKDSFENLRVTLISIQEYIAFISNNMER